MKEYAFQRIFLATDDVDTVNLFKKEFGEKLLTYADVTRSDGEVSVAFSEAGRMNHHYLLGQEVLRDMYTLAKCDGLIAGKSQVSICAYIQKRTTGDYCYREILDAGYNTDSSRKFSDELQRLQLIADGDFPPMWDAALQLYDSCSDDRKTEQSSTD